MIDVEVLKKRVDLLAIAGSDTQLKRVAGTGGGEYSGPCPFCGGRDRFSVQPNHPGGGRWMCRHCVNGKWNDAISYVMQRDNVDFKAACAALGADDLPKTNTQRPPPVETPAYSATGGSWQDQALQAIDVCGRNLWSNVGLDAKNYLLGRGISEDFIKVFLLGYSPGVNFGSLWVPRGVVIPCVVRGEVWYLKIRLLPGESCKCNYCKVEIPGPGVCPKCDKVTKYKGVRGNRTSAIYGAEWLLEEDKALFCEGELDAIIATQEIGDLIPCATMGAASNKPDLATWGPYLLPLEKIFAAYDTDQAGKKGAAALAKMSDRVQYAPLPEGSKDINDYHLNGGDLRGWWKHINELEVTAIST